MRNIKVKTAAGLIAAAMLLSGCGDDKRPVKSNENSSTQTVSSSNNISSEPSQSEVVSQPEKPKTMDMFDILPEIPVTDVSAFEYRYDEALKGIVITDFLTENTAIRIPDTIEGKPVVGVSLDKPSGLREDSEVHNSGSNSFEDRDMYFKKYDINELILPDTVRFLHSEAPCTYSEFSYLGSALNKVEYMNVPAELSSNSCRLSSLKALYIPEGKKYFPNISLTNNLETIYLPSSLRAFSRGTITHYDADKNTTEKLSDLKIYYNGETYSEYTDELHHLINDVNGDGFVINNGVLTDFYSEREDVVIPDYVTAVDEAFYNCSTVRTITIPARVEEIRYSPFGSPGFSYCDNLTTVTFEKGSKLKSLAGAFYYCPKLKSINIPDSVEELDTFDTSSFVNCPALTNITFRGKIYDSIDKVRQAMRFDKNGLLIENGVLKEASSDLTKITIPDTVTQIGANAFRDCASLKSVTISESVTEIHPNAFSNCTDLYEVKFGSGVGKNVNLASFFSAHGSGKIDEIQSYPNSFQMASGVMTGNLGKRMYIQYCSQMGSRNFTQLSTVLTFGTSGKDDIISYSLSLNSHIVINPKTDSMYEINTTEVTVKNEHADECYEYESVSSPDENTEKYTLNGAEITKRKFDSAKIVKYFDGFNDNSADNDCIVYKSNNDFSSTITVSELREIAAAMA